MWQMYIRGKLLFVGHIFTDHSRSVRDLHRQIIRSKRDYRLGLSLPSDYKFRYNCTTLTDVNLCDCRDRNITVPSLICDVF